MHDLSSVRIQELTASVSRGLLKQAQAQDQRAWDRLVETYGPFIYRWCRRWGASRVDAGDIVQEVFLRVSKSLHQFQAEQEGASLRGWLWKIARNATHDHFARLQGRAASSGGTDALWRLQQIPEELPSDDPSTSAEPIHLLHSALDAIRGDFQEKTWTVFWRSTMLNDDPADIARDTGLNSRAIRQAKYRVLNRLREECQSHLGGYS